jgi:phenylalanyl-tRNA synthetase alpha chain
MSFERLRDSLAVPDLTEPANGLHAVNIVVGAIQKLLKGSYDVSVEEIRASPQISVKENFDDLLFSPDNAGRSSRYTRYVDQNTVLRTHTTAAVPKWLKEISVNGKEDVIATFPGICYRRDVINKTHTGEPHQMDVWRIRKGRTLDKDDLLYLVKTILEGTIPGYEYRANGVQHPYTTDGLEIEVKINGKWLELLECGLAHPTVLENAGLNSEIYSGLALGMGLDRLVMIIKKIDDIRILRSNDPRIRRQMVNLEPFKPVSNQPATKRVLSYSVNAEEAEEDVCEKIRDALGPNAAYIEEINYSEIPYRSLPLKARTNLGILSNQKNVVVELVFRSLEESLPKGIVNGWIASLYPKLNEGSKGYY